jgi:vanillate/4-hydroxybenzoate decarboxylase subunit D
MTASIDRNHPTACPRCRSGTIKSLAQSPVAGVWTVFGCSTCFYSWRSTEPEENVNPEKYPAAFRLRPEDIPSLSVIPTIPPRRSSQ